MNRQVTGQAYKAPRTAVGAGSKRHPIYLACGASDAHAIHLTVTLTSALRRIEPARDVHVCVMDGGISEAKAARIRACLGRAHPRAAIQFIRPDVKLLAGVPTSDRYPLAVYFRLLMPFVLPHEVEAVLYLDTDIVVTDDVSQLFNFDFGGRALWAAKDSDTGVARLMRDYPEQPRTEEMPYFNGGVMLMNLPVWRRERVTERVLELVHRYGDRLAYFEQDPMNMVLAGKWGVLHGRWNNIIQGQSQRVPEEGGILHFAGKFYKPWHWGGRCRHEDTYHSALVNSGWLRPHERAGVEAYRAVKSVTGRLPWLREIKRGIIRRK